MEATVSEDKLTRLLHIERSGVQKTEENFIEGVYILPAEASRILRLFDQLPSKVAIRYKALPVDEMLIIADMLGE